MCEKESDHVWEKAEAMGTGKLTWYCIHCPKTYTEEVIPISPEFRIDKDVKEEIKKSFNKNSN